jgi:hypothetical protein
MISTGMDGIDDMLGGGIPEGSKVLYSMEPGVDGQLFMISTLHEALAKGRSCLVILPHTTVDAFLHDAENLLGSRLGTSGKTIVFFDAVDRDRIQRYTKDRKTAAREWQGRITKLCTENHIDVIFMYLDVIYDDFGLEGGLGLLPSLQGCDHKPTLIIEHLNFEGENLLMKFIGELGFDLVISIRGSFLPTPHFNLFTIVHASWSPQPKRSVPFLISGGRVVPYIPKIVVTGPPESGKSVFVAHASENGLSVDRRGLSGDTTTVAMDFGWVRRKDFDITLYGTPGQPRFDPMIPVLLKHAIGVVLVIDATKADQIARARYLYRMVTELKVPAVIAANKNDLQGRMSESEIRDGLGIAKDIPVLSISAQRREDVLGVLESLVDFITQFSY